MNDDEAKRHYSDEEWILFVRSRLTEDRRRQMEAHAGSCERCRATVKAYREVHEATVQEDGPPDDWIDEGVRALESVHLDREPRELIASLTFDSLLQGASASRSAAQSVRLLTFEAGPYQVDVSVDTPGKRRLSITGQIHRQDSPDKLNLREVLLHIGTQSLKLDASDRGEFFAEIDRVLKSETVCLEFRFLEGPCLTALLLL